MSDETTLRISLGHSLAYHRLHAQDDGRSVPGIVFLSGFKSDMRGIKATWLADWCAKSGRAFVRFDYRGHGESTGSFADLGIGDWAADACHVIDQLTEGPQILVGSSMGGWIALLLARLRPESIAGLVGIAAAPDFTEGLLRSRLTAEQLEAIELEGRVEVPSQYSDDPYI
ncbi:MAG: alpha/beta hydrolase, partial [Pseudomonadota bacterium]